MTHWEAGSLALKVRQALPGDMERRLKAIHVIPRLHQGMLTIRVYCVPRTAEDPEPFVFNREEL